VRVTRLEFIYCAKIGGVENFWFLVKFFLSNMGN
jgi:hypothetical protein